MKDFKIKLEWSTSDLLVWVVLSVGIGLCIVNFFTIYNEIGEKFIPLLIESLDPLNTDFNFIEF